MRPLGVVVIGADCCASVGRPAGCRTARRARTGAADAARQQRIGDDAGRQRAGRAGASGRASRRKQRRQEPEPARGSGPGAARLDRLRRRRRPGGCARSASPASGRSATRSRRSRRQAPRTGTPAAPRGRPARGAGWSAVRVHQPATITHAEQQHAFVDEAGHPAAQARRAVDAVAGCARQRAHGARRVRCAAAAGVTAAAPAGRAAAAAWPGRRSPAWPRSSAARPGCAPAARRVDIEVVVAPRLGLHDGRRHRPRRRRCRARTMLTWRCASGLRLPGRAQRGRRCWRRAAARWRERRALFCGQRLVGLPARLALLRPAAARTSWNCRRARARSAGDSRAQSAMRCCTRLRSSGGIVGKRGRSRATSACAARSIDAGPVALQRRQRLRCAGVSCDQAGPPRGRCGHQRSAASDGQRPQTTRDQD